MFTPANESMSMSMVQTFLQWIPNQKLRAFPLFSVQLFSIFSISLPHHPSHFLSPPLSTLYLPSTIYVSSPGNSILHSAADSVTSAVQKASQALNERGERLGRAEERTADMMNSAEQFSVTAHKVRLYVTMMHCMTICIFPVYGIHYSI